MTKPKTNRLDEARHKNRSELIIRGIRGKYATRFREGTNLVLLEPDVAEGFPTAEAVNGALRLLINVAKTTRRSRAPSARRSTK